MSAQVTAAWVLRSHGETSLRFSRPLSPSPLPLLDIPLPATPAPWFGVVASVRHRMRSGLNQSGVSRVTDPGAGEEPAAFPLPLGSIECNTLVRCRKVVDVLDRSRGESARPFAAPHTEGLRERPSDSADEVRIKAKVPKPLNINNPRPFSTSPDSGSCSQVRTLVCESTEHRGTEQGGSAAFSRVLHSLQEQKAANLIASLVSFSVELLYLS